MIKIRPWLRVNYLIAIIVIFLDIILITCILKNYPAEIVYSQSDAQPIDTINTPRNNYHRRDTEDLFPVKTDIPDIEDASSKSPEISNHKCKIYGRITSGKTGLPLENAGVECNRFMNLDLYRQYPALRDAYSPGELKDFKRMNNKYEGCVNENGEDKANKDYEDFINKVCLKEISKENRTDSDGYYEIWVSRGHYYMLALHPNDMEVRTSSIITVTENLNEIQLSMTLNDQECSIEGHVCGVDSEAIGSAKVSIFITSKAGGDFTREEKRGYDSFKESTVFTDKNGNFAYNEARVGNGCKIIIKYEGYRIAVKNMELAAGVNMVNARLEKGRVINGIVVDREGKPIHGVRISYIIKTRHTISKEKYAKSGNDGKFSISGINENAHLEAVFQKEGYVPIGENIHFEGKEEVCKIVMRIGKGGIIEGYVRDSDGKPVTATIYMQIVGNAGSIKETETAEEGYYSFENLAYQKYYLHARPIQAKDKKELSQKGEYTAYPGERVNIIFERKRLK